MWEMLEDINFECDDCGGPGPPPKFMIPPPPRPPFMQELIKCKDDDYGSSTSSSSSNGGSSNIRKSGSISSTNSDINYINNWDSDICDAIPILDASYHSSPSLQTSAIIAVFSLLLVLVVLVSSLFVWKHKRKVQNFLPCKTPTRGPHIGGNIAGGHSVTYEDPDAHLGHRPLVMRHHNVEIMHHSKSIHYPSGFPMTRSPPLFVCSSPGPDPYRSNDNVYEELGPTRDSDIESEPDGQQSDDDFAEDELSLPGERSFNKTSPPDQLLPSSSQQQPVSTIYHERSPSTNLHERNTLLTTSVHSEPNRLPKINRNITATTTSTCNGSDSGGGGILSGVFRHTTGRNKNLVIPNCKTNNRNKYQNHNTLPYNIDSNGGILITPDHSTIINHQQQSLDILPPQIYDDPNSRNSLMTLAYNSNSSSNNINNNNNNNFQTNNVNTSSSNNLNNNNNNNNNNRQSQNCYNKLESEVERRNRINNQLHQPPIILLTKQPPVATIFRGDGDRINYTTSRYPQPYYTHHHDIINNQSKQLQQNQQFSRSRTNPRSLDRRRIITTIPPPPPPPQQQQQSEQILDESTYGYAEPVFHEGLLYNNHHNHNNLHLSTNNSILRKAYPSYILPDYTTGSYRTIASNNNNNQQQHNHHHHNHQPYHYPSIYNHQNLIEPHQTQQLLYSRDSSFGSDSGYSHNTQGSSLTGDIVGRSGNCRNGNNSNNCIRTPTTSNLLLPLTTAETKYHHGQQNYNNCTTNNKNINNSSNSNCSNILWNRKIPPSVSSLSSQSTNNSISSSSGCTKDNNLLSQGTNSKLTTTTTPNNTNGTGIISDDDDGGGVGLAAVDSEHELTTNNCNNSKNSISNVSSVQQSQYNPNNNNLNVNNQIMSNTSKSNSNNSLGSINNNSNLNCLSGISGSVGGGGNSIVVDCISNSTNSKT